jgi:ABC-type uncharacterized transport system fused permease/ATPase subunit
VGLRSLVGSLDEVDNWSQRLSLAEQQQLAFARILLAQPALVFLDDATAALDEAIETKLYGLLRAALWRPTLISASYKATVSRFHNRIWDICTCCALQGHLTTASTSGHIEVLTDGDLSRRVNLADAQPR